MAEENSNVLTNHYDKKKIIQFFVIMVVTAIVWNLPIDTFGIDGLTMCSNASLRSLCSLPCRG